MTRKTYQTYKEAYDVARLDGKGVYAVRVPGSPAGWRITTKRHKRSKSKMAKITYKTKEEAYEVASRGDGNLVYKVKNGWRIRKRSKSKRVSVKAYTRKKSLKNSGQFPRSEKEDEIFTAKLMQVRNLIEDYLRLKEVTVSVENKITELLR